MLKRWTSYTQIILFGRVLIGSSVVSYVAFLGRIFRTTHGLEYGNIESFFQVWFLICISYMRRLMHDIVTLCWPITKALVDNLITIVIHRSFIIQQIVLTWLFDMIILKIGNIVARSFKFIRVQIILILDLLCVI